MTAQVGRPRQFRNAAEKQKAYRERQKAIKALPEPLRNADPVEPEPNWEMVALLNTEQELRDRCDLLLKQYSAAIQAPSDWDTVCLPILREKQKAGDLLTEAITARYNKQKEIEREVSRRYADEMRNRSNSAGLP